jgi:hypothetical protein
MRNLSVAARGGARSIRGFTGRTVRPAGEPRRDQNPGGVPLAVGVAVGDVDVGDGLGDGLACG